VDFSTVPLGGAAAAAGVVLAGEGDELLAVGSAGGVSCVAGVIDRGRGLGSLWPGVAFLSVKVGALGFFSPAGGAADAVLAAGVSVSEEDV